MTEGKRIAESGQKHLYRYYIKLFSKDGKVKTHCQIVKVCDDGIFYSTTHRLDKNFFANLLKLEDGKVIYDRAVQRAEPLPNKRTNQASERSGPAEILPWRVQGNLGSGKSITDEDNADNNNNNGQTLYQPAKNKLPETIDIEENRNKDLAAYDVKVSNKETLAGNMSVHSKSTAFRKGTDYIVAGIIEFVKTDLEKYLRKALTA